VKRFLALVALLLGFGQAWGAIVNTATGSTAGATSTTTLDIALTGTGSGDFVASTVSCYDSTTTATISAQVVGEGSMTTVGSIVRNASFSNAALFTAYYPALASGGSKTVRWTFSAACFADGVAASFSGVNSTPFDVGAASGTAGTVTFTTAAASELVFGMSVAHAAPGTPTDDGGYTAITLGSNVEGAKGYYNLNVGTAGSHTVTSGTPISVAAFKISAGGGSIGTHSTLTGAGK
jgi:hypothetical protein